MTGTGMRQGSTELAQGNSWLGLELQTAIEPAADAWHAPIETVSNSEAGFERVYQGSALLLSWPVKMPAGAPMERDDHVHRAHCHRSRGRGSLDSSQLVLGAQATRAPTRNIDPARSRLVQLTRPSRPRIGRAGCV